MLLAVDIGNSNLTLGWFRGGTLVGTRRAATASMPMGYCNLIRGSK